MRKAIMRMEECLRIYEKNEKAMYESRNTYEWHRAENNMKDASLSMKDIMDTMVSELNCLMSNADTINIFDFYTIEKKSVRV